MRDVKWHEVLSDRLQSPDGGGGDRPRPFIVIAIWTGVVLVENRGSTVIRAKVSSGIMLCTCAGVSELLVHDEWRGSSFPSEKAFSAYKEWGGMTATGAVAVQLCVTRTTAVCGVRGGQDWGHTRI